MTAATAQVAQMPQSGTRVLSAIILYVFGIAAFFVPWFVWPSSPIDPLAIAFNILVFSLTLYSTYKGQTVLAFFNSVCLFFVSYPFLLQYAQGVDLSEHGYVRPLSLQTASVYALYLIIITLVAARNIDRQVKQTAKSYRIGPAWILVGSSFACLAAFIFLFGTEAILFNRLEQFLQRGRTEGTVLFVRGALRIVPYWLAYMVAVSSTNKGRSPLSISYFICFFVGLVLCNPINSARFYSLTGIFVALYPLLSYYRMMKWLPVVFPLLMAVVLPVTSYLRYGIENMTLLGVVDVFYSLEFSSFQVLNDGVRYLGDSDWGLGIYSLSALFIFVPRSFWPDKNPGTGETIGFLGSYQNTNVGVSPHLDAYLDLGVVGVVMMAIVVGYAYRAAHAYFRTGKGYGNTRADTAGVIVGLIPLFVRGDFSTFTVAFYSFVIAYWLARLVAWASSALSVPVRAGSDKEYAAPDDFTAELPPRPSANVGL